jgi:transcriptional regulator with GAF, ATPase, and Fis domain
VNDEPEQALEASLAGLAQLLLLQQPLEDTLTEVAAFATEAIPGADGAGLTLLENNRADTIVASADFVRAIDEWQYRIGEGPCLLAVATQLTQVSGSLGGETRWPRFGPRAGRLGVHSALSLPLLVKQRVVGALNVYSHEHHAFDNRAVRMGELFSRPAAVTAANALLLEESRRLAEQLERALISRAEIDQAIGIIMSRSGSSATEAFQQLRRVSQTENTRLADIAQHLVQSAVERARERHRPEGLGSRHP